MARIGLAALALALILVPAEAWGRPRWDFEQQGFDPELSYAVRDDRFLFDPFMALEHGTWATCPCRRGSLLTLQGNGFADGVGRSANGASELSGVRVLVDGQEAPIFFVTPSEVDFLLPYAARPPSAAITVLRQGRVLGQDTVLVQSGREEPGGSADITQENIALATSRSRDESVHLVTTPLPFRASFIATIDKQSGDSVPLRVMLWNPRNYSSFEIAFEPEGRIRGLFVEGRGKVSRVYDLGSYTEGEPVGISVEWKKPDATAAVSTTVQGLRRSASLTPAEAPALFDAFRPALTVASSARGGEASVTLSGYRLQLPPYRFATVRVNNPLIPPLTGLIALLAAALSLPGLAGVAAYAGRSSLGALRRARNDLSLPRVAGIALALAAFAGLNAWFFTLGRQPFDMTCERIWAYLAATYDLSDLYYRSETATLAGVWRGIPYHEAIYPYGPGMSYYFWTIGKLHLLLFGDAAPDASIEYTIKAFNLAFLLVDGALVYALVRKIRPLSRWLPWVGAAILLLSPALILDASIHGETDSVLLALLFASLLAALHERPLLAWFLLSGAFLTKQTAVLPVVVIGLYYMIRFPWRRNLEGVAAAVLIGSFVALPFTFSGYPPSVVLDPLLSVLALHAGSATEQAFRVLSFDGANLWSLVVWPAEGVSSRSRYYFPDYEPLVAGLSYQVMGRALFFLVGFGVLGWMVLQRKELRRRDDLVFVLMALFFLAQLVLYTGSVARYFVFPLAFSIPALARPRRALTAAVAALSLTAFVGNYGSLTEVLDGFPEFGPALDPDKNPFSAAVLYLFHSDVFISVACVLNLLALFSLTLALRGPPARATRPAVAPVVVAEVRPPGLSAIRSSPVSDGDRKDGVTENENATAAGLLPND